MKTVRSLILVAAGAAAMALASSVVAQPPAAPAPTGDKPKEVQPTAPTKPESKPESKPVEPAKATEPAKAATPSTPSTPEEKLVYVKVSTNKGDMVLELNNEKAPISTKNFLAYVDDKFYDGTIFHRVKNDFMIQGGGFTPDMNQKKTKDPIKNEWQNGLKNTKYTVAMARLGDQKPNPKTVDSATAQFFINVVDNGFLDAAQRDGGAYAVFGKVISGMDVVDKIKVVKTGTKSAPNGQPFSDVPVETVTINSITRMSAEDAKKTVK